MSVPWTELAWRARLAQLLQGTVGLKGRPSTCHFRILVFRHFLRSFISGKNYMLGAISSRGHILTMQSFWICYTLLFYDKFDLIIRIRVRLPNAGGRINISKI